MPTETEYRNTIAKLIGTIDGLCGCIAITADPPMPGTLAHAKEQAEDARRLLYGEPKSYALTLSGKED